MSALGGERLVAERIQQIIGHAGVEQLSPHVVVVDWEVDTRGKAVLLAQLLAHSEDILLDVEEAAEEWSCKLELLKHVTGNGNVYRITGPCDIPAIASWLCHQQWLLLAGPKLQLRDGSHLQWSVARAFSRPDELQRILEQIEAEIAILSYFDDVAWLIVAAPRNSEER
jgi:hypothetical protein